MSYSLENGSLSYKLDDNRYLILLIDKKLSNSDLIVAYDKVIPERSKTYVHTFTYKWSTIQEAFSDDSRDVTDSLGAYEKDRYLQRCFIFDLKNNKIIRLKRYFKYNTKYGPLVTTFYYEQTFVYELNESDCKIERFLDFIAFIREKTVDIYSLKDGRIVSMTKEEFEEMKKKDKANKRKRVKERKSIN